MGYRGFSGTILFKDGTTRHVNEALMARLDELIAFKSGMSSFTVHNELTPIKTTDPAVFDFVFRNWMVKVRLDYESAAIMNARLQREVFTGSRTRQRAAAR